MNPLLLTAALAVGQLLPNSPANRANAQGANTAATASLDGNWTIVAFEKNGQSVLNAQHMQVTIKNGTVQFTGKGANEPTMRLELGQNGTIRLLPQGQNPNPNQGQNPNPNQPNRAQKQGQQNQGQQNQASGPSAEAKALRGQELPTASNPRPNAPANNQNANPNPGDRNAQTGAPASQRATSQAEQHAHHPHHGVYVMTKDYFAASLFDDASGAHGTAQGGQSGSPKVVVILRRSGQ